MPSLAEVTGARICVITVYLHMQAGPVHTVIICAIISVIQNADRLKDTVATLAEVIRARIAIIADHRGVGTISVKTLVHRTGIIISTVNRGKFAIAIHAGIIGTEVAIVADNRLILANPAHLAKIFGARIVVLTFKTIRAPPFTGVNGTRVIIRAG